MRDDLPARRPGEQPEIRISDADRDRAVALLRQHCTEGRLTLDEFSDRVGLVFAARTASDVERVMVDLPDLAPPATMASPAADRPAPPARRSRAVRWTVSIFGGNNQRGRWRIEGSTNAVAFMGGCHLDLREAEVIGSEAVINAYAFMGGVDVTVPEGIDVVLEGFAFMGGRHARVKNVPLIPGAPTIRVRAFAFMGGVNVRSRGESSRRSRERHGRGADARRERLDARRERMDARRDRLEARHNTILDHRPPPPRRIGIEAVAADVRSEWHEVRQRVAPEGTVTIMFSDIEGFTSMCEQLGDHRANEILREHYRLVRDELARHGGFEVKVHGDGFMVAFSSASRALRCATAIQQRQREWNDRSSGEAVRVRMGLHTGEAIRDADDFLGTTVNLASRIADAARGEEILVSRLLRELCVSTGEFRFDDGNDVQLKGISQPHRVYAVQYR